MLFTLAISGYRSLKEVILPLDRMNLVTGPNGSGKSSIYRALRLLADTANGNLIRSLAMEGGFRSALWAGPEKFTAAAIAGTEPVQGLVRKKPIRLQLGFSGEEYSYSVDLGLPVPSRTAFGDDPVIKRECLWRGPACGARDLCADRKSRLLRVRPERKWLEVHVPMTGYRSMLTEYRDPESGPEIILASDLIRSWRFYDHFRTDVQSPVRSPRVSSFTPVLAADGSDLAAALQTIREIGDSDGLSEVIDDAFPGSTLEIPRQGSLFSVGLKQPGMLRSIAGAELSDGTLRYLLLAAALMTPRPPGLMVLNEPETSLHQDLLPALGRLIERFAENNQIVIVTHSSTLIDSLSINPHCAHFQLEKNLGATSLAGVDPLELPMWKWPSR